MDHTNAPMFADTYTLIKITSLGEGLTLITRANYCNTHNKSSMHNNGRNRTLHGITCTLHGITCTLHGHDV